MPKFLIPHRTGAHRIAAIALFRALLTQCKALQLSIQQSAQIQNIVRNRFKAQRHITSWRQLTVSFTAGYEALDHLDAAVAGNGESKEYLLNLLDKTQLSAKQTPPPPSWVQKKQREIEWKENARTERESRVNRIDLFARPLPLEKLSGKRHVPVLFNANRIPVLRLKKPQPAHLSAYINSRIATRQKRQDRRWRLEDEINLAREEDRWDTIVHQSTGVDSRANGGNRDPLWQHEPRVALQSVSGLLENEKQKNREMAEKMQAVVDRETELARQEKAERKRAKSQRNWARKYAQKEQRGVNTDAVVERKDGG